MTSHQLLYSKDTQRTPDSDSVDIFELHRYQVRPHPVYGMSHVTRLPWSRDRSTRRVNRAIHRFENPNDFSLNHYTVPSRPS